MEILVLRSSFQPNAFVKAEYADLLTALESSGANIRILGEEEDEKEIENMPQPDIVMTATGGVENLFVRILPWLKSDVRIIADGRNNSLAAALEILSYLRNRNRKGMIIHGTISEIIEQLRSQIDDAEDNNLAPILPVATQDEFPYYTRICCFGEPSDWLISSNIDAVSVKYRFGIELIQLSLDDVIEGLWTIEDDEIEELLKACNSKVRAVYDVPEKSIKEALKIYLAIKRICEKYQFSAITIRCFDIVKMCSATSCLALAMLNDDGIVAGCEGDLQTLISMLMAKQLCQEKAFMANPCILTSQSSLFAHCTIPLSMCNAFDFRTHFESSAGLAVAGELPLTDYTVFKWGGHQLQHFFVAEAPALDTHFSEHFCRTQIKLELDLRHYLLHYPIGNHQVIIKGRHAGTIRDFMSTKHVTEIA